MANIDDLNPASEINRVSENIVSRPLFGPTVLGSDPSSAVLAYTVSRILQGVAGERSARASSRRDPIDVVSSEWDRVLEIHRVQFPLEVGPVLPPPAPLPEFEELVEQDLLRRGVISGRIRGVKDADRDISETAAAVRLDTMRVDAEYALLSQQSMLEDVWERLLSNEPEIVAGVLAIAFRQSEFASRPLDVAGNSVVLEVLAPTMDRSIPERKVGVNRKGQPSTIRASRADRNDAYRQHVLGGALLAARQALAVAPGMEFVDISVLTVDSKADAVAGGNPKGLARFFVSRSNITHANLRLPADEVVLSCAHANRISLARNGGLKLVSLEYEKKDKQALAEMLDPDADDHGLRDRLTRLGADAVAKSTDLGARNFKRLSGKISDQVGDLRNRSD